MVHAKAWYHKVPEAEWKLGVLVRGFSGIVLLYPLKRMTVDVAPVVYVMSSAVFCDQCCGEMRTMGRSSMCTDFGINDLCVLPLSSFMRKLNIPRPMIQKTLAMPLHSIPLSCLYDVRWYLFGDMQPEAKESVPSQKESVSKRTELESLAVIGPAKAWYVLVNL